MKRSESVLKKKHRLHRKGSIARHIQDWFISSPWDNDTIMKHGGWCWCPLGMSGELCVAMEWQDGYAGDEWDMKNYAPFIQNESNRTWVLNVSIKFTQEFRINGEMALYAETYFLDADQDLEGGTSLCAGDIDDGFYGISKHLAENYNWIRFENELIKKAEQSID